MKVLGSVASLVEAVRQEAEDEAARTRQAAETEADRLRGSGEGEPAGVPDREARLESARREATELLAREDWADRRAALEQREEWMAKAAADGLAALRRPEAAPERRELLERFAFEALEKLPGESFEVFVAEADGSLLDEETCRRLAGARATRAIVVRTDASAPPGSCLVRTGDGKASFDNGLDARARRFAASYRAALAEIYGA